MDSSETLCLLCLIKAPRTHHSNPHNLTNVGTKNENQA